MSPLSTRRSAAFLVLILLQQRSVGFAYLNELLLGLLFVRSMAIRVPLQSQSLVRYSDVFNTGIIGIEIKDLKILGFRYGATRLYVS